MNKGKYGRFSMKLKLAITLIIALLMAGSQVFAAAAATKTTNTSKAAPVIKVRTLNVRWKNIGQFAEGLCPVQDSGSGLWGFVDRTGKYKIAAEYNQVYQFCEGLAAVNLGGLWGFVNKSGKIVIEPQYDAVYKRYTYYPTGFTDGYAVVSQDKKFNLIDKTGKAIKSEDYNCGYSILSRTISVTKRAGFIFEDSKLYDTQYNEIKTYGGYYGEDSRYVLYNESTKYLAYNNASGSSEDFYIVNAAGTRVFELNKVPENLKVSKVGITNDYVILQRNVNGVISCAVMDYSYKLLIGYKYKDIHPIGNNLFVVTNYANKYGIIDKTGKVLIPVDNYYIDSAAGTKSSYFVDCSNDKSIINIFKMSADGRTQTCRRFNAKSRKVVSEIKNMDLYCTTYLIDNKILFIENGAGSRYFPSIQVQNLSRKNIASKISCATITLDTPVNQLDIASFFANRVIPTAIDTKNGRMITFTVID